MGVSPASGRAVPAELGRMLHGIVYARHVQGLATDLAATSLTEVWSYFATGNVAS